MWTTFVVGGAFLGLLLGWERATQRNEESYKFASEGWLKFVFLAFLGAIVASQSKTVRGFLVVYLSTLGAYYFVRHFGEIAQIRYFKWRRPYPEIELRKSRSIPNEISLRIHPITSTSIRLDNVILRRRDSSAIRITKARSSGAELSVNQDGWLCPRELWVSGRGFEIVDIVAEDCEHLDCCQIWGSYSNDVSWSVIQKVS